MAYQFEAQSVEQLRLDTVERYYEWAAQANSFAPPFERLTDDAKAFWRDEYARIREWMAQRG